MKFTPKSESELKQESYLLQEGDADFQVSSATEEVSKAGNDMIKLKLKVWDGDGKIGYIFDYLVSNVQWKLKQFLDAVGKSELYKKGDVQPVDLQGLTGKLVVKTRNDPKYGEKSIVQEFLVDQSLEQKNTDANDLPDFDSDEDVPF